MPSIPELLQLGIGGLAIVALVAGWKEYWFFGPTVKRMLADKDRESAEVKADRDWWKQLALKGMVVADKAVDKIPGPGAGE